MSDRRPAFYAPTGSLTGDFVSLLHFPYTLWHLSYVPIGAALAAELDWLVLGGTLAAFAVGLGALAVDLGVTVEVAVGAEFFDEVDVHAQARAARGADDDVFGSHADGDLAEAALHLDGNQRLRGVDHLRRELDAAIDRTRVH